MADEMGDEPIRHEPIPHEAVRAAVEELRTRLDALTDHDVRIIAVTKGFGRDAVDAALAAGVVDLGENFAQELLGKVEARGTDASPDALAPRWHFIGNVQRNKVRGLAPHVALWQTVDRVELAEEIARRAPGADVLVQANVSGEPQKAGCTLDALPALVRTIQELGLGARGVMAVGPEGPPEAAREPFRRLVALADELALAERSLGMTADLEVAVQEGSTMVRVGRGLFGPRPPKRPSL